MKSEPGEVGGEPRLRAGDAEVRHHRQAQAAADRGAVHRRDDRLFGAEQPVALDIKMRGARPRSAQDVAAVAIAVAEIGAGAKRLALRGQHQRAATGVVVERFERGGDFADQRDVEKIIRRPSDLDQRDVAGFLDADILERAHETSSLSLFGRARG